jgi:AcrR family transcriptional regulator
VASLPTRHPEVGLGGRRKRRPERHDEILLVAADLFARHGYHETSVEDIAAVIGVSATAIYRHFRTKQEILDTAALWINDSLVARHRAVMKTVDDPTECLVAIVEDLIDAALSTPTFIQLFVRELHSLSPEARAHCIRMRGEFAANWCRVLRAAHPSITAPQASTRVHLVLALICGVPTSPLRGVDAPALVREMALGALCAP